MYPYFNEVNQEKPKEDIYEKFETNVVDIVDKSNQKSFNNESPGKFKRSTEKSQTTKGLSWLSSVKKVSSSVANSRLFIKDESELLFCISVDGSKHSDFAFDMVTENFFFSNTKLLCVHVFNSKLDTQLNYNNKKVTVLKKYESKIEKYKKHAHFVTEDKISSIHALEQASRLAVNYHSNFIVCGYQGLKGPRGCNNELAIGHDYLLTSSKTPVMLIKEETIRENKKDGYFNWLIILDKQFSYPAKAFQAFIPLINPQKDHVFAYGCYEYEGGNNDVLKDQFMNVINKHDVQNFTYNNIFYTQMYPLYRQVIDLCNFGNTLFDFIVINNNSTKYRTEPETNDASNIIKLSLSNICFINN